MKTEPNPKRIYEKYSNGDSLTDEEVEFGVKFYKDLADKLISCGPVFWMSFKEANQVYMCLEDFQRARTQK
jgi:hypothetical protein